MKAESGIQMTKTKSIQAAKHIAPDSRQDRTARRLLYRPQINFEGQALPDVLPARDHRFGAAKVAFRARLCGILVACWQWDSRYCLKIRGNGKNRPFQTVGLLGFTLLNFGGILLPNRQILLGESLLGGGKDL